MTTPDPKNVTTTITPEEREKAVSLAVKQADVKIQIRDFLLSEASLARFSAMMSTRESRYYISTVLMAVANNSDLQSCTKDSILKCALRAASLELSCDEGLHQGQLVPYKNKAKLVIHYLGLVNLAQRTGKYRTINWGAVTENMTVEYDVLTGLYAFTGRPDPAYPTIGYFAYFELLNGYRKSEYMTVSEIHEHAKKWSPSYSYSTSPWNDPKKRPAMEQKTVIRKLMKQADMSGKVGAQLASALSEDDFIQEDDTIVDATATDVPEPQEPPAAVTITNTEPLKVEQPAVIFSRPLPAEALRSFLAEQAKAIGIYQHKPEQVGLMVAMMEIAFAPDPDAAKIRRSCIRYLFGYDSSKKMSGPQVKATLDWLAPTRDNGGAYSPDSMAVQELHAVWTAENLAKGQETLPGIDEKKGKGK